MDQGLDGRWRRRPHLLLDGPLAAHQVGDDVYGNGEHDGAVLLGRDVVQSLQIPQLEERKKS